MTAEAEADGISPSRHAAATPSAAAGGTGEKRPERRASLRFGFLLALLEFGDLLFWGHAPGLSVALFVVLVAVAVVLLAMPKLTRRRQAEIAGLALVAVLPVLEHAQPLSMLLAATGLLLAVARAGGVALEVRALGQFLVHILIQAPTDLLEGIRRDRGKAGTACRLQALLGGWALPVTASGLFLLLFAAANPVIDAWLLAAIDIDWTRIVDPGRVLFWCGLAWTLWPCLVAHRFGNRAGRTTESVKPRAVTDGRLVNATSVRNSLILFNLMFGLQGALDGLYLWAGAELPRGMTYADYAHRGAYPLIGAALLAGRFAMLARPHLGRGPWVRLLLGIWLIQTLGLVGASITRLDLYVDVYGLTYLRFWALVWMILVGAGLALVACQMALDRSNGWLVRRVSLLAAAVLYGACFVNAAQWIAHHNLARLERGARMDLAYLCSLGPMAATAFRRHEVRTGTRRCRDATLQANQPIPWREWGFRRARVRDYVLKAETAREAANDL